MSRRGVVRKRWDRPNQPWYVICYCVPESLYRIAPASHELQQAMLNAIQIGFLYDPEAGWRCAQCVAKNVRDQLDMCLAKPVRVQPSQFIRQEESSK